MAVSRANLLPLKTLDYVKCTVHSRNFFKGVKILIVTISATVPEINAIDFYICHFPITLNRVAIHLVFPRHVLFFRVKNSVRADFFYFVKCPVF